MCTCLYLTKIRSLVISVYWSTIKLFVLGLALLWHVIDDTADPSKWKIVFLPHTLFGGGLQTLKDDIFPYHNTDAADIEYDNDVCEYDTKESFFSYDDNILSSYVFKMFIIFFFWLSFLLIPYWIWCDWYIFMHMLPTMPC